jgi:hypothetical protein
MKNTLTGVALASQIGNAVYRRTHDAAKARRVHQHIKYILMYSVYKHDSSDLWLRTVAEWMEDARV